MRKSAILSYDGELTATYRHFSSRTLITGRIPLELSLGVGAAASEPSPRNNAWSSHLDSCAASRMVKGRTRTVTEMDDAPSAIVAVCGYVVVGECAEMSSQSLLLV
jgi:hypothetical protein